MVNPNRRISKVPSRKEYVVSSRRYGENKHARQKRKKWFLLRWVNVHTGWAAKRGSNELATHIDSDTAITPTPSLRNFTVVWAQFTNHSVHSTNPPKLHQVKHAGGAATRLTLKGRQSLPKSLCNIFIKINLDYLVVCPLRSRYIRARVFRW